MRRPFLADGGQCAGQNALGAALRVRLVDCAGALIVCPLLGGQRRKVVAFVCRARVTGQGVKGDAPLAAKLPRQFLGTVQASIKSLDAGALPRLTSVMGCGQSVYFSFPFGGSLRFVGASDRHSIIPPLSTWPARPA